MKKTILTLISCALCIGMMTSCVSNKKMIYLQGATQSYALPQEIKDYLELQVQPDDQLAISVASKDVELLQRFNNNTLIGGGNNSQAGTNTINVSSGVSYFRVDKDGNIEFPIFGTIHVGGMTTGEVSSMIQERMKNEGYVYDAVVNTKIMSFKVTENGQRKAYEVNLLDNQSVFSSPAYYLQQNDVIYVQPNKSQRVKGSTSYTWLSVGSTVVGMIVSIVSLIVALKK